MNKEVGRFYFKQTVNKNLIGEFSNSGTKQNFTESADVITGGEPFIGEYLSTYQEDSVAYLTKLKIDYKDETANRIYSLSWVDINGKFAFKGEGFLVDNILIGDYQSTTVD
jgi:hypothetical protein